MRQISRRGCAHPPCLSADPSTICSDFIGATFNDKYWLGLFFGQTCTSCCFTMTNTIQVCSDFRRALVFLANTRPDDILSAILSHSLMHFATFGRSLEEAGQVGAREVAALGRMLLRRCATRPLLGEFGTCKTVRKDSEHIRQSE